jgi:arylsulfatase A-like enzyme
MKRVIFTTAALLTVFVAALAVWIKPDVFGPSSPKPNVVIILVDTLRSDHLGVYGYERDTSPEIDAIASGGTVFSTVYSVSDWTNPTIKSMFTGLSPQSVMREAEYKEAIRMPLPEEVTTFAELFKERGYHTAALVDHPGINSLGNYDQGFDYYKLLFKEGAQGRGSWGKAEVDYVGDQFNARLDQYQQAPFLLYLHVNYPHLPFQAPDPCKGMFGPDDYPRPYSSRFHDQLVRAYDAEIRRTDDLIKNIHESLASRGLLENTWLILTSDHGEGFWEHGLFEHGESFFNEVINVPLIIVPPIGHEGHPSRVDVPVSNIDVFSTILDIADIPVPKSTVGVSLIGENIASDTQEPRVLFSESPHSGDIHARAIIRDGFKYVHSPNEIKFKRHLLFNLEEDPDETRNIFKSQRDLASRLSKLPETHKEDSLVEREWLAQKIVEPDEATLEGLKTLGYIQ